MRIAAAVVIFLAWSALPVWGAGGPQRIQVRSVAPLAKNVDSLPRVVASGRDSTARLVNAQIAALDRRYWNDPAVAFCRTPWDGPYGIGRDVTVTLRGARYLSLFIESGCDRGAHPATNFDSAIFDLRTGTRLKPSALLPRSLRSANAAAISRFLSRLYMERARTEPASDCITGTYSDGRNMFLKDQHTFTLWLDARADGIGLIPDDFPFVSSVCDVPLVIPTARLRALGVDPSLLDDIDLAHARGWYEKALSVTTP